METGFIHGRHTRIDIASIEPWIFIHGNVKLKRFIFFYAVASIEPWIFIHGNKVKIWNVVGRSITSFNRAMNFHSWKHDHTPKRTPQQLHCFNRAMNFHSWKHQIHFFFWYSNLRFNRAMNFHSWKLSISVHLHVVKVDASIEPWIFIHGNLYLFVIILKPAPSFNRAMNFHSWKRGDGRASPVIRWSLQ